MGDRGQGETTGGDQPAFGREFSRRELLACSLLGTGAAVAGMMLPGKLGGDGGTVLAAAYGDGEGGLTTGEDASDMTVTATGTTEPRRLADAFADFGSIAGFGAAAGQPDATAVIQAAIDHFDFIDIPPGTYSVTTVTIPGNKTVRNRGHIQGTFKVAGPTGSDRGLYYTDRVNGSGSLGAGTSTFAGGFSGFASGDFVVIGLQGAGLASTNQQGFDFGRVTAVSALSLTIDTPTRWGYPDWFAAKAVGTRVDGELARGSYSVAGDYTGLFAAGDLVRIENINGMDDWFGASGMNPLVAGGAKAYFEIVRVKAVNAASVVFEQETAYHYTDFYLVKMDAVSGVVLSGGYIDTIVARGCDRLRLYDIDCRSLSVGYTVGAEIDQIRADGDMPTVCGFTHVRDAAISNVVTRGGTGTTDNGSFKMMSPIHVSVANVRSYDTVCTSAQGVYPFFLDFYYTPYAGWGQQVSVGQLSLAKPKQGAAHSLWATGMRELSIAGVTAAGTVRLSKCSAINVSGVCAAGPLNLEDLLDGGVVSAFQAAYVNILGCSDLIVSNGVLRGAAGQNAGRAVWVRAGSANPTSDRVTLQNIKNRSTTATDTTLYLQSAGDTFVTGCSDRPGLAKSVQIGSNAGPVHYGLNALNNAIDLSALTNGRTVAAADIALVGHRWDRARLQLGGYYVWIDAGGTLRLKNGAPTGDTDGTVVGAQS